MKIETKVWWKKEPHMSGFIKKIVTGLKGRTLCYVDIVFPIKKSILIPSNELVIYKEYIDETNTFNKK